LTDHISDLLREQLADIGVPCEEAWVEPINTHIQLLKKWSKAMNLTSVSEPRHAVQRHVVDSLALLRLTAIRNLSSDSQAADIGSGAGFPGLPLAIALQNVNWTLVEPRSKRGVFLQRVISLGAITNATWLQERIPSPALVDSFDLVVSRATFPVETVVSMAGQCTKAGGALVIMGTAKTEISTPPGWMMEEQDSLTLSVGARFNVVLRRGGEEGG
jgi:16S rRNA (guanine527-N7)-methyltransferase